MSDHQELRERIAVAADKHLRAMWLRFNPTWEGYGPEHAERLADAVLDALGLEQVGWFVRFPSGIEAIALAPFENDSDMGKQEPVYRLTGAAEGPEDRCPECGWPNPSQNHAHIWGAAEGDTEVQPDLDRERDEAELNGSMDRGEGMP